MDLNPLRLLTAAMCEQYFNQGNRNPFLTRRTAAITEGVRQHGPMEEWRVEWMRLKWTEIETMCPCLSLLQEEARPPVVSSGQNWKRSGNIPLRH